jgi:hypothetical protein
MLCLRLRVLAGESRGGKRMSSRTDELGLDVRRKAACFAELKQRG